MPSVSPKTCERCGSEFIPRDSGTNRYCSRACYWGEKVKPGDRFERLVVVSEAERARPGGSRRWLCQCDCGGQKTVLQCKLLDGNTRSCGCLRSETTGKRASRMFKKENPLREQVMYHIWQGMRDRCYDSKAIGYDRYGGRGIVICARWQDFEAFRADMGTRPTPDHSIDRVDNDGGYWCGKCPECVDAGRPANCRWATRKEQGNNRGNSRLITFEDETLTLTLWAERKGLPPSTLNSRLLNGWSIEDALNTPIDARYSTKKKPVA